MLVLKIEFEKTRVSHNGGRQCGSDDEVDIFIEIQSRDGRLSTSTFWNEYLSLFLGTQLIA